MPEPVQMKHAFSWVCPCCRAIQYVDAVLHEFNAEDKQEFAEGGFDNARTGDWHSYPEEVICEECGNEYETTMGEEAGELE